MNYRTALLTNVPKPEPVVLTPEQVQQEEQNRKLLVAQQIVHEAQESYDRDYEQSCRNLDTVIQKLSGELSDRERQKLEGRKGFLERHTRRLRFLERNWEKERQLISWADKLKDDYFDTTEFGLYYKVGWCDGHLGYRTRESCQTRHVGMAIHLQNGYFNGLFAGGINHF